MQITNVSYGPEDIVVQKDESQDALSKVKPSEGGQTGRIVRFPSSVVADE